MNTRVLEEHGTVIYNKVDTGELLPRLNEDPSEGTETNLVVGGAEAVEVRRLAQLLLFLEGGADFVELGLKFRMVWRKGNETGKGTGSVLIASLLDEPSGRFWEENHASGEDEAPDELNCYWNLP